MKYFLALFTLIFSMSAFAARHGALDGPGIPTIKYGFRATHTTAPGAATGTRKVLFQTEEYDIGSNFASSTFTAPAAGYYSVSASVATQNPGNFVIYLYKNGSIYMDVRPATQSDGYAYQSMSTIMYLAVNDTLEIYAYTSSSADLIAAANASWFNVILLGK